MKYRFWVLQDPAPLWAPRGNPQAPSPDEPIPGDLSYPGREAEGIASAVDQIMQIFTDHGVADLNESAVIRCHVTKALLGGSYRTTLPTPGRWLLAEEATGLPHPLDERTQA